MARQSAKLIAAKRRARREGWADMIRSEADERAVLDGFYFSRQRADHICEFGPEFLVLSGDYDGQPFELCEWQREQLMRPLYGWVYDSPEYGRTVRRYRRAYIEVPKKNGKSPLGYYVALYHLAGDGGNIRGARVYSASTDKEQASIVHGDAITAVEASPRLSRLFRCNRTKKNIYSPTTNGFYRVLSSCPKRNEGWNASAIIADELHKWYGRELWDALRWAFATRAEPMLFAITTAGDDTDSVCYEQHNYALAIAEGRVYDPAFFGLVFAADPTDDIDDSATWRKANPSLGLHLKESTFRADLTEAQQQGPASVEAFKQLRLNIWRETTTTWLDMTKWDAGPAKRKRHRKRVDCWQEYTPDDLAGRPCWAGLDLALTQDLTALVLVFPNDVALDLIAGRGDLLDDRDACFWTLAHAWLPEATVDAQRKRVRYTDFAAAGSLTITEGSEADFDAIRLAIVEAADQYELHQLLYDPLLASYLTARLELDHGIPRCEFPQRLATFSEPVEMLERLIGQHRIRHTGDPLLTWCLRNTRVKESDGRRKPVKPKRGDHRRIDLAVALIMALAGALRGQVPAGRFYDDNDPELV